MMPSRAIQFVGLASLALCIMSSIDAAEDSVAVARRILANLHDPKIGEPIDSLGEAIAVCPDDAEAVIAIRLHMEYECAEERIDGRRVARQWPGADAPGWYRGGKSQDGTRQFDEKRPGWEEPIHQLMVDNGVTIFERKEKTLRVCLTLETKLAPFNANGELVLEREIEELGNTPRLIADDNGGMYLFGTSALSSDRTIGVWIARVFPSAYDIIARRDGRVITCDTTAQLPPISTLPLNAAPDFRVRIARLDADLKKLRDKPFFGRAMPGAATLTGPAPYDCSVPKEDIG